MDTEIKIYINNDLDIVMARMQAREVAKKMGFNTADQARISLAASELARVLSWMPREPGEIVITSAHKNGRQGLQVVCTVQSEHLPAQGPSDNETEISVPRQSIAGACQLVDESMIEPGNNQQARVTLTKWQQ